MAKKHPPLKTPLDKYLDFIVVKATEIPELQCFLTELVHTPTGAQIMHLGNDDPENLFCLSFQTLPPSSNGVAHILEHTVLCGSEKFPVKDPFFAMTRRSLNTYMNALTGQDFTCYPASSQVTKDFYNLLEVYLDAVFKPNLKKLSFLQEGHRLEFSIFDDPNSPLEYKGIVFNEMKGAMSSPIARLGEILNKALFPDTPYGFNSGGDPKNIPELTYEELVEFHKQYYHPSRCLFFFYGNLPLTKHLDFIAEHTLNKAKKVPPLPLINSQKRFLEPLRLKGLYPIAPHEEAEDKALIGMGWLTCHILEQHEILALNILEIILMDTDASPLKMSLLKSGLCKTASAYIDVDINEIPFVIILKGCKPENAQELENLVRRTLGRIVEDGIPLDLIENAMHQLEFFRSEITGDQAPFGLSLFMRSGLLKQHNAKPEEGLMIHSLFDRLRKLLLEDPQYLTKLIQKYLLDNTHFVRVILEPSIEVEKQELEEEKLVLLKIQASMSDKDTEFLVEQAKELKAFQRSQEEADFNILPKVNLQDVPVYIRNYDLSKEEMGGFNIYHHTCFTNEITYADISFPLSDLKEEDLPYARLFSILLPQMGCGDRDYIKNLEYIQANTGGIHAYLTLNTQAQDSSKMFPSFSLRGKALHRKTPMLFELLTQMATSVDFKDVSRLRELIQKHYTGLESSLNQNSLRYAINLSASKLSIPAFITNAWYGLDYFWKIKELALNFDKYKENLVQKLMELNDVLLSNEKPDIVLSCDARTYDELKGHHFYGLLDTPLKSHRPWKGDFSLPNVVSQGRVISTPVAFIGKVFSTVSYTHDYAPALNIAAFLFDNLTLHSTIREQGGAYGGGAVNNAMMGYFYFYSYRDPNILNSLEAFEKSIKKIVKGDFDEDDIEEAKLEMVQSMDSPVSPGSRADLAYGWLCEGKTPEIRQEFRNKTLALTKDQIIEAVSTEIAPKWEKGATVVFAGKDLLEKENKDMIALNKSPLKLETV